MIYKVQVASALAMSLVVQWLASPGLAADSKTDPLSWPALTRQTRPWAYWWWLGSAVDRTNLTRELERYRAAGLGGVHIIPIYGAEGFENRFINFLSPAWMDMMGYCVREAQRLDMGVDMTTGSGWCFGGPHVTDAEANASVVPRVFDVADGASLDQKFDPKATQALIAFPVQDPPIDLSSLLASNGVVNWTATGGPWRVYAISQKSSGQKVKRAGPGGQGHMLNLFYPPAMTNFLSWFEEAFSAYQGPLPRAMYHDSYEYQSDWAPDLFAAFKQRRGYRLQDQLPALFASPGAPALDSDHVARVKHDYRETLSDTMAEATLPLWVDWSHRHHFLTRNEAHGSPGNLLDLYAVADIPETEMFNLDRNKLVSKFASSAAHVAGRPLVSSETGTWIKEHFTETLADVKYLFDDMLLSGVNHMFYHGICYSPDEAGWPGWHFYASLEMNPRNSIWRDAAALNTYATRCQAILQSGQPDNDILVYWPIHDFWQDPKGLVKTMTVSARDWLESQPIGKTAEQLWNRGYAFDFISDHLLAACRVVRGRIQTPGAAYRVVVVPPCRYMPVETMRQLVTLTRAGGAVIFETGLPGDVPGWADLESRRAEFRRLLEEVSPTNKAAGPQVVRVGQGKILLGELEPALAMAGVARETLFDHPSLMCIRRATETGHYYFIANRSDQVALADWVTLAVPAKSVVIMDPLTGRTGLAATRVAKDGAIQVYLRLNAGDSIILNCLTARRVSGQRWNYWDTSGVPIELSGTWQVRFIEGGPLLPASFETSRLASWTELGGTNAQRFAGTARHTLNFDRPSGIRGQVRIDLGKVAQSARVRLNGKELGTLLIPPFAVTTGPLKPKGNLLEVEVTSVAANRIRDLDRRGVPWKTFYDVNFVNLKYRPFNAADWPLTDAGLLGPVTLTPLQPTKTAKQ